ISSRLTCENWNLEYFPLKSLCNFLTLLLTIQKQDVICVSGSVPNANVSASNLMVDFYFLYFLSHC
uniref:Uncharacterized protein n=1 Tax=Laticauda laticaudata TaxID=8630 RepID=A0A8C5SH74_LATLA